MSTRMAHHNGIRTLLDRQDWMERALCAQADPEAFFPEKGESVRAAKQLCRACPVAAECLTYALEREERFGVWGGCSERERRALSKGHQTATLTETCPHCDRKFRSSDQLDNHTAAHHAASPESQSS